MDDEEGDEEEEAPLDSSIGPHTRNRPKNSIFDSYTRGFVERAQAYYRMLIATQDAFPNHQLNNEFVVKAWDHVCREADGVVLKLDRNIERAVCLL